MVKYFIQEFAGLCHDVGHLEICTKTCPKSCCYQQKSCISLFSQQLWIEMHSNVSQVRNVVVDLLF